MTAVAPAVPVGARTPWKGLAPYDDSHADAGLFFGRDREIAVACANLRAARLTVLFGASGVGKSSLLRAGVIRQLRDDGDVAVLVSSWTGDPVEAIAEAARTAIEASLGYELEDPGVSLAARLRAWTDALGDDLLLVLDQAEEYFLYHEGESGPGTFAGEFPGLVTERGLRVNVLLGIREDALGQLDVFRAAVPGVLSNYLRLERLDRDAGRLAILGPIARWNEAAPEDEMTAEPALVEAVLDEVAAGRIEPEAGGLGGVTPSALVERIEAPYLQLVLERLWETERAAGSSVLRRETLRRLGGAALIVEEHVERSLTGLGPTERHGASVLFGYLVTPSGTKIAHRVDDLSTYSGLPMAATAGLVGALVQERILRPADGGRVEIYHDVLASAVADWRREQEAAEALEQERKRHRRLLAILAGALVALGLVGALAIYAVSQRNEAQEQTALAQANEQQAQEQTEIARANEAEARKQANNAKRERDRAQRAEDEAQANAAEAQKQKGIAEDQAAAAQASAADAAQQQQIAEQQAAAAQASKEQAQASAAYATKQQGLAQQAAREAQNSQRQAQASATDSQAREYAALARSNLTTDPQKSVDYALRAFRLRPGWQLVEDVLRESLIELRLVRVLEGGSALTTATFSPDGALVVTAGDRGEARIFRVSTGRLVHSLRHAPRINDAAFSPDGRTIATAAGDGTVVVWDVGTGVRKYALAHGGAVRTVDFSRDGRLLATGGDDRLARIWDLSTGIELYRFGHPFALREALFSPDGRYLATHTVDAFVRVYHVASGASVASLEQPGEVTTIAWSPAGDVLGSAGRRNGHLWSTATWERLALLEGHTAAIRVMVFSPDGARVVTGSVDSSSRVYRVSPFGLLYTIGTQRSIVTAAAFARDGESIVTGSTDTTARVSNSAAARGASFVGHTAPIVAVAYRPGGDLVLTASRDGQARLWEPTGDPYLTELGRHPGGALWAEVSPDGALVASAGADGTARIWRLRGGLVATLQHGARVNRVAWVAGGQLLLTASDDGTARLWRRTGHGVATFTHGGHVRAAGFAADGSRVVTAGDDGTVRLWRPDGRPIAGMRHADAVTVARFSPDSRFVLTGSADRTARIWRASDGGLVRTLRLDEPVSAAAWSPDGALVATGTADGGLRTWSAATGAPAKTLSGHENGITSIAFSRDGKLILAADRNGDARTWRAATGTAVNVFRGHVSVISDARFSPDGRWVVTAGPSAVGLWQASTGSLVFFVYGHGAPLASASFSPDGRQIVSSGTDGTVRRYRCDLCGSAKELAAIARARQRALARP
jgi:WD40 repeat protein/cytoskeletal protein RodZ